MQSLYMPSSHKFYDHNRSQVVFKSSELRPRSATVELSMAAVASRYVVSLMWSVTAASLSIMVLKRTGSVDAFSCFVLAFLFGIRHFDIFAIFTLSSKSRFETRVSSCVYFAAKPESLQRELISAATPCCQLQGHYPHVLWL